MREIEVKARVTNHMGVITAARRYGIFLSEPYEQHDTIFKKTGAAHHTGDGSVVRLRQATGKVYLTVKSPASHLSKDNHETETEVGDFAQAQAILRHFGYEPDITIKKRRQSAAFKGYEICLDQLEDLGEFIEIEKLAGDDADAAAIQDDMYRILKELGLSDGDRIHDSYPVMVRAHLKKRA